MKIKSFFLLVFFVFCLSVSFAQTTINTHWYLLNNDVEVTYRNNQNVFIRVLASDTADVPADSLDAGVIIKPYENFSIPADVRNYFVKTFSGTGELIVVDDYFKGATVDVGSLSLTVDPTYTNQDGTTIPGKVDSSRSVFVNIASDTIGFNDKLETIKNNTKPESSYIATRTITLTANVNQEIVSTLSSANRKFIEITTHDQDKEFTVNLGGAAIINDTGRKCFGGFGMKLPKNINLNLISSETIKINVIEGGY